nr:sulfotransferase [Pseudomonas alcaliphila]
MQLDFIVGGMPRGGTTVAAKFLSLHDDVFCYAGETHLVPMLQSMFAYLPCRGDQIDVVIATLRQQLVVSMLEMPRFNVSKGAHPKNIIFNEKNVDELVERARALLLAQLSGVDLYQASLIALKELLAQVETRSILGEKTPNNIFSMANYAGKTEAKSVVVIREPFGVLRSMSVRVKDGDPYSNEFKGGLERNIGLYLEYADAANRALMSPKSLLVRYEDMALSPSLVVTRMHVFLERIPEDRVLRFVENGNDSEIAERAPMNYRRLFLNMANDQISPIDAWKILNLTRSARELVGYSDEVLAQLGLDVSLKWPGIDVPQTLMPLSGFHQGEEHSWMKRKGSLIAYFSGKQSYEVTIELESVFPEQIKNEVKLDIFIDGVLRESLMVAAGYRSTTLRIHLHADELKPICNKGAYVIIDLESSLAFSGIGSMAGGNDSREISFRLSGFRIDRCKK